MKKNKIKSNCCKAKTRFSGNNLICIECNKPCSIYIPIRKVWKINPATRIKEDKREKTRKKEIEKEIKEIREIGHA